MRATLVYNGKSGAATSEAELRGALADIGWVVERRVSPKELDLSVKTDVVVVAGGDGTIGKVAKRIANTSIPMAILPMGTANNFARSLGLGVDAPTAIHGLARPVVRRIDLGVVRDRAGEAYFLEGFGIGVFAYVLAEKATNDSKKLRKARGMIADHVDDYEPMHAAIDVDGRDLSGAYVVAAVMNARSIGPALGIAPEARCDDGVLDVVLIKPESKRAFATHVRRAAQQGDVALPAFDTARARRVRVRADGTWAHVDGTPRQLEGDVLIEVAPGVVNVIAPARDA